MHLFTSEIAAIKSELNVIKPKQEEITKLMAENILLLRRNLGVFELTKTVFPIQSVDQLEKIENDLKTDKQLDIIGTIKDILCGSLKNLGKILDKRIIMTYNYDGMKGKKSLKSYESLMNAVFEATKDEGVTYDDFVKDFRNTIRRIKNTYHKGKARSKNPEKKSNDL
ncbi:uncharacterized protein LOC106087698 [Stomoxys calcitrans]|uniref:uncharacterized protein LOC106087698 n=1 Tax=Stomoxys calcitrans TaxID=35570 RepID=UPI0027E26977|nr:uncharacterized protein LOC106087698 [Stomoxys calcitrans]